MIRRIEVLQHTIQFTMTDTEGNLRSEPLIDDSLFAEHINDAILDGYDSGTSPESLISKDGDIIFCTCIWKIEKPYIEVFAESKSGYNILVATFDDENLYTECFKYIQKHYKKLGFIITERINN